MKTIDVLFVVMNSSGRDVGMLIPILYYCEKIINLSISIGSGVDARYWLDKLNPKLFILPNSVGDNNYIKAVKYAAKRHISTISLTSEGDLNERIFNETFWGLNTERKIYEDINLQWSERSKEIILKHYPELNNKIIISGGIGFDRYKIYKFINKEEFFKKYKKDYKKIVCIVGWGFDSFFDNLSEISQFYNKKQIEIFKKDRIIVNEILRELIKNNKDILFILKYHPGSCKIKENTEFFNLEKNENVIEIQHEEDIANCINVSDFLMAYDSTSAMEAWLLNKQTFLVNPSMVDFPRSQIYLGSPILKNYDECQKAINEFYGTSKISGFEEKSEIREKIIKNIIGWSDGKNHIRTGKIIKDFLEETSNRKIKKAKLTDYLKHYFIHIIFEKTRFITKYSFINKIPVRKIGVLKYCQKIYNSKQIDELKRKYYPYLDEFHNLNAK